MHIKDISHFIILFILLSSCSKSSPKISVGCEENLVGNNIIKWEVIPKINGTVKVYASNNPYDFKKDEPIGVADVNDQRILIINNEPSVRKYYKIVFGKDMEALITSRNININNVENFRDLGGYRIMSTNRGSKWGQIFRSGDLHRINSCGVSRLQGLGVKTIVNLNPSVERNELINSTFNYINIPIYAKDSDKIFYNVYNNKYSREDVNNLLQDVYRHLVADYKQEYKQIFGLLLDEKNYPIVFECATGKEQTGIVSFLILTSLGVDVQTARLDYLRTNQFIDMSEASKYASNLPTSAQEALTGLLLAQEGYINAAINEMKTNYGSIEGYLKEGIGLSQNDIDKLRMMLLED